MHPVIGLRLAVVAAVAVAGCDASRSDPADSADSSVPEAPTQADDPADPTATLHEQPDPPSSPSNGGEPGSVPDPSSSASMSPTPGASNPGVVPGPSEPAPSSPRPSPQEPSPVPVTPEPNPATTPELPRPSGPLTEGVITLDGTRLLVNGEPLHLRGVCWNPVPKGAGHPEGLDYRGFASIDLPLMQAAGINAVRTYEPITDVAVLDQLAEAGIYLLNSIYPWGGSDVSVVTERVQATRDHPAVLMWVLGNEWNYNGLYVDLPHAQALARLNEAAALVRAADDTRPIMTIYGELPSPSVIQAMPEIDVWGINAYRGISFGDLFSQWQARSSKPMLLAEYGADAYNANVDAYDPVSQADATRALTREIVDNGSAFDASKACVGGTLFEWADEWWKDSSGSPSAQDVGGIAPGGGPHPDATFNEEWWGIVDIDRVPRPAYTVLQEIFSAL